MNRAFLDKLIIPQIAKKNKIEKPAVYGTESSLPCFNKRHFTTVFIMHDGSKWRSNCSKVDTILNSTFATSAGSLDGGPEKDRRSVSVSFSEIIPPY